MFNMTKQKGFISAGVLAVSVLAYSNTSTETVELPCHCSVQTQYDDKLPMSSAHNLCAVERVNDIDWLSWLGGDSRSTQFHFLDLLELISKQHNDDYSSDTQVKPTGKSSRH